MNNPFTPPLIGPFVEANGKRNMQGHTGAAITWTSCGEAYRLDLTVSEKGIWTDTWTFAQAPDFCFESFLWRCFEHNGSRLPDFLNELRPYIRPSKAAPNHRLAFEWLNPHLVKSGFSLGIAKVRKDSLRVPLIWMFQRHSDDYQPRQTYSRIDFIDWTPNHTKLLDRPGDHWGTGARALKRYLHQLVGSSCEPLLTEKGQARMEELYREAIAKERTALVAPRVLLSLTDKSLVRDLRKGLPGSGASIPPDMSEKVARLSEKAYAGLLRTCTSQNSEVIACALLKCRSLPQYSRINLLERFIECRWGRIWEACAGEAATCFTAASWGGFNELLYRAVETGDSSVVLSILAAFPSISKGSIQYVVGKAFTNGHDELGIAILNSPIVKPIRDECLLSSFEESLSHFYRNFNVSIRLLELGAKPITALAATDEFGTSSLRHYLLDKENFTALTAAADFDPLSDSSLSALLIGYYTEPGETFLWLCSMSRDLDGHQRRMSRLAFRSAIAYIRTGCPKKLKLLQNAHSEGGSLTNIPISEVEGAQLFKGRGRRREQDNWIDLIGSLMKLDRHDEANVLKKLKRNSRLPIKH